MEGFVRWEMEEVKVSRLYSCWRRCVGCGRFGGRVGLVRMGEYFCAFFENIFGG